MITAEVEPFSQFFADAVELPLFRGTMLTVLLFVFIQDPIMGIASIAIIHTGLHHPETSEED